MSGGSFRLSSLDLVANLYVDILFVLDESAAPTFDDLRRGLDLAVQQYPELSGVISEEDGVVNFGGHGSSIPLVDGGSVPFTFDDFQNGDLRAPAFTPPRTVNTNPKPLGTVKKALLPVLPTFVQGMFRNHSYCVEYEEAKKAVVVVKYTRLVGADGNGKGAVIGLGVEHRFGDAHATGLVAQTIAHYTRWSISSSAARSVKGTNDKDNDLTSETPPAPFANPLIFDRAEYLSKAIVGGPKPNVPPTPDPLGAIGRRMYAQTVAKKDFWYPIRGVNFNHSSLMSFRFSPQEQATIKAAAQSRARRHGHALADRISTRDAVAGYLFSLYLAATHVSNIKNRVAEDPDRSIGCAVALNVRSILGIDDGYMGNAPLMPFAEGKVFTSWLSGAGAPALIREVLEVCKKPEMAKSICTHINDIIASEGETSAKVAKDKLQITWCYGQVGGFGDGMTSDWTRMGWSKCHFTPSAAAADSGARMIVTPTHLPTPGHIKLIDDVTAPENGTMLCHLFLNAKEYEELAAPGGALVEAAKDLEWIGREWDYSPNPVPQNSLKLRVANLFRSKNKNKSV